MTLPNIVLPLWCPRVKSASASKWVVMGPRALDVASDRMILAKHRSAICHWHPAIH